MPKGVFPRSEAHKRNLSEARKKLFRNGLLVTWNKGKEVPQLKGEKNGFFGKKHTPEALEKMRQASLKQEHRPHTEETKRKLSIAHKGMKKGIKLTEEHRRKIGQSSKGSKSARWRGGITPFRKFLRTCFEYNEWRRKIYERDSYACVIGGVEHGNKLHADHIKPFYQILDEQKIDTYEKAQGCKELWDISNGRTLCKDCHRKITNEQVKLWSGGANHYTKLNMPERRS